MRRGFFYALVLLLVSFVSYGLWQEVSVGLLLAGTVILVGGMIFTTYGLYGLLDPYTVARFFEQLDAIGSTRRLSSVEPVGWKVSLTKVQSIAYLVIGVFHLCLTLYFLAFIS